MGKRLHGTILAGLVSLACSGDPEAAELTARDSGKDINLAMNQHVYLTLQTVGPGQFGEPELSSDAVRFEGMILPPSQNPGGPTQVYHFRTVAAGTSLLTIPHDSGSAPFTARLFCCAQ